MSCIASAVCSVICQACFSPCGSPENARLLNALIFAFSLLVALAVSSPETASAMQRHAETNAPGISRIAGTLNICRFGTTTTTLPPTTLQYTSVLSPSTAGNVATTASTWSLETASVTTDSTILPAFDQTDELTACIMAWSRTGASRIMWANFVLFMLMSILTLGVKSQKDCRFGFHSGSWGIKIILITVLCVCSFMISPNFFATKWQWVESFGSMCYNSVQVWVLVRGIHSISASLRQTKTMSHGIIQVLVVLMIYAFCYTVSVFQYRWAKTGSFDHVISIENMVLMALITAISLMTFVREATPASGLTQASVVSLQIIVFTYGTTDKNIDLLVSISSGAIFMFCAIYMCFRLNNTASAHVMQDDDGEDDVTDLIPQNNNKGVGYSCSFFHLFFALASLRVSSILSLAQDTSVSDSSIWVMVASSILVASVYVWSLIYPVLSKKK